MANTTMMLKRDWPDYVFLICMGLMIVMTIISFAVAIHTSREEPAITGWCEVGTINDDGTVSYHGNSGTSELILLATTDGPKIMSQNCK